MVLKVFSVFDSKLQVFNTPFFSRTVADATRSFSDLVRDGRTTVGQHPEDFFLYDIGLYSDETGEINGTAPNQVAAATAFVPAIEDAKAAAPAQAEV
jgi:hypothetical protein